MLIFFFKIKQNPLTFTYLFVDNEIFQALDRSEVSPMEGEGFIDFNIYLPFFCRYWNPLSPWIDRR